MVQRHRAHQVGESCEYRQADSVIRPRNNEFPDHGLDHVHATGRQVFDVTGAGDTVLSVLALAAAAGATLTDAAILANTAAGVVVGKLGTATVTPEELQHALMDMQA